MRIILILCSSIILQLEMLKEKELVRSYSDGGKTIVVDGMWHWYSEAEATTLRALEDHCWVYEVPGPHLRHEDSGLYLCDGGWEKIQRIYLNGSISNVKNLRHCKNVRVLKLVNCHMAQDQVLDLSPLESLRSLEIVSCTFSTAENSPAKVLGLGLLRNLVVLRWDKIPALSP